MEQLILHLIGDYVTQSDWMANEKTKRFLPAFLHALVYSVPFLLIGTWAAVVVIFGTHFFIDRYRLARFVCYGKNVVLGLWLKRTVMPVPHWDADPDGFEAAVQDHKQDTAAYLWENCATTGYPSERLAWMAVWLLIACDNTLHLGINWLALKFL